MKFDLAPVIPPPVGKFSDPLVTVLMRFHIAVTNLSYCTLTFIPFIVIVQSTPR